MMTYKKAFCAKIISSAKKGLWLPELAADLGVPKNQLMVWAEEYPDFKDALALAMTCAESYYFKTLRTEDHEFSLPQIKLILQLIKDDNKDYKPAVKSLADLLKEAREAALC